MANLNTSLAHKLVDQSIDLLSVEKSLTKQNLSTLKKMEGELIDMLNVNYTLKRGKRLNNLIDRISKKITQYTTDILKQNKADLAGISKAVEVNTANTINLLAGGIVVGKKIKSHSKLVQEAIIEGTSLSKWWKRVDVKYKNKFIDTVNGGIVRGLTNDQIISELVGKKVNKYKDGKLFSQYRGVETLVRTSINSVANKTSIEFARANSDVMEALQWHSTLDNQTSIICISLDGLTWTLDLKPIGHNKRFPGYSAHPNCRGKVLTITKPYKDLNSNKKELVSDTRSTMDGQISDKINYEDWLKDKPKSFQKDVLGKSRYELWKKGRLGFKDLTNASGQPMTVAQLKNKYGV